MTSGDFVRRIENFYGSYDPLFRNEILVLAAEMEDDDERDSVYRDCIRGFTRKPSVADIAASLRGVRKRAEESVSTPIEKVELDYYDCGACGGLGWIQDRDVIAPGYTSSRRCEECDGGP